MFYENTISKDDYDIMRRLVGKYTYDVILSYMTELKKDKALTEEAKEKSKNAIIKKSLKYICEHYNEDITLSSLSEVVYIHPKYLSKLFKDQTGYNFIYYIKKIRIHKACLFLRDESLSVESISEMVGYRSDKYFYKVFKSITGCTPKEYRTRACPVSLDKLTDEQSLMNGRS